MLIYLNSKYVRVSPAQFNDLLPGHLEGVGAFETMRMYRGRVFAFDEHMDRLACGLKHFGIRLPLSRQRIARIIKQLSRRSGLVNSRVRVVVWRQKTFNVSISLQQLRLPKAAVYRSGYRVKSVFLRTHKASVRPDVKSVDYKFFRLAHAAAAQKGFDEVVFFNSRGHLVEGSRTNIFFVKDDTLFTPSLRCGCLNGITRRHVIDCARNLGLKVKQVQADKAQLLGCDEAFLTGSTLEIMPVKSIDGKSIGKGSSRRLSARIRSQYAAMVRKALST